MSLNLMRVKRFVRDTPPVRRFILKRLISAEFPAVIGIESTNACNLNCIMCPRSQSRRKVGFMDMSLFDKITDECREWNVTMMVMHRDGEPLLHPELDTMVRRVKEKRAARYVQFTTNGLLLDKAKGRSLIEAGLDWIRVSINAVDPETYRRVAGRDALPQVEQNVMQLHSSRNQLGSRTPYIVATMVVMDWTAPSEVRAFRKKWSGVADELDIYPCHTWDGSINTPVPRQEKIARYPCPFLWYHPYVGWDGVLSPCCVDFSYKEILGNVGSQSIENIWKGSRLSQLRQAHLDGRYEEIALCSNCTYWSQGNDDISSWLRKKWQSATGD